MNQEFIREFENILEQVLSYEGSCEGEVGNIKIEKDTSIPTQIGMSRGLVGCLYIFTPERIRKKDIRPFLKENEKIKPLYMKFTPKGADPQSFYVTRDSRNRWENILDVNRNKFATFVENKNGKEYINERALEIIKAYLNSKNKY